MYDEFDDDFYDDDYDCDDFGFEDPGGNSSLRRETESNPRNQPCPTCGEPNTLTPKDVKLGYQCDCCADRAESGFGY
jgi:hypothetical protein